MARYLADSKDLRAEAAGMYPKGKAEIDAESLKQAFFAAKRIIYAQGLELIEKAKQIYGRTGGAKEAAKVWRGGCIIRCALLGDIAKAYENGAEHLMVYEDYAKAINIPAMRKVVAAGVLAGVPLSVMSSALAYAEGLSQERLPSAIIQAARDCFGAHGFEDADGNICHVEWL